MFLCGKSEKMIVTNMDSFPRYFDVHPRLKDAYDAMRTIVDNPFEKKRYIVDGEKLFVNSAEYDTKARDEVKFEAHRKYIDMMLILSGEEMIAYLPVEKLSDVYYPYNADRDALLATMEQDCGLISMKQGDIAIFFPEDAHAPGFYLLESCKVRKLIAKVLL